MVFTDELITFFREVITGFTDNDGVGTKNLEADPNHVSSWQYTQYRAGVAGYTVRVCQDSACG